MEEKPNQPDDPRDFFTNFERIVTVWEPTDKSTELESPIVRSNLFLIFEKIHRQDQMTKSKQSLDKLSSSKILMVADDKENRNPNLPKADSKESLLKLTPRTFLRQKENSRMIFGGKDKGVFKKIESKIASERSENTHKVLGQERNFCLKESRSGLSNVQALKKLIKQTTDRTDNSLNRKKEQLYASIFGGRPNKSGGLNKSRSNAFDIPRFGQEYSKYGLQNPSHLLSRKNSRIKLLQEKVSSEASLSNSRIDQPGTLFRSKELALRGTRFNSQSDLNRPTRANQSDLSLNYLRHRCANAATRLAVSNRPPSSQVVINMRVNTGQDRHQDMNKSDIIDRQIEASDNNNVYKHFRQMLAKRCLNNGVTGN